jgi:peptidoglycan biosynthesis protein MviN/MurJ (putative lipid II flippase)
MFGSADTRLVHTALAAYALLILPLFLLTPLDQVFQVEGRIGVMVRRTLLGLAVNAVLNAWFLFGLGWGLWGIALATSISQWVLLLLGLEAVQRLGITIQWRRHLAWGAWLCLLLALLWPLAVLTETWPLAAWVRLAMGAAATLALLLLAGLSFPGGERAMVRATLSRIRRAVP